MSQFVKRPWLLLSLLVLSLQSSWGQAPAGLLTFNFSSTSTALYDLSGQYELDQPIIGAGGTQTPLMIENLQLTHGRSGRLSGTGWIQIVVGDSVLPALYNASGQVSGGGNRPTKVQLSVHLSGSGLLGGVQTSFSISVRYNLTVDPGSMALVGPARGNASFTHGGGGRIDSQNVTVALQPGVDGTWSAQLDVTVLNRLTGGGNLVLSNGRTVPVSLNGSYIPISGLSKLRANGYNDGQTDGRGSLLQLDYFSDLSLRSVSGTILGQKVVE